MMKFLRSQSQTVLVVVLGVIGLGFLFYGNSGNFLTTGTGRTSNDFGRIDGEDLTVADLTEAVRNTRNSMIIHGQGSDLRQPGAAAKVAELAWGQLLMLHEADRLHLTISDKELVDFVHSQPIFQKDGVYSPAAYQSFITELKDQLHLPDDSGADPLAGAKAEFETVLRNDLTLEAVSKALFSSVRGSAQDVSTQYEKFYGPATVSVVTIDPKTYIASAKVTEADIENEYKTNPTNPAYRTDEKRKVDYVLFLLPPDQAKLPDAQKAAALNALGEKATKFALAFIPDPSADPGSAFTPPDFLTEARKEGLSPATTDFFAADTQPANVPPSPAFNSSAFSLTKDSAISKVVELENGFAVQHLDEIQPSELRPLEEVKAAITSHLQQTQGQGQAQFAAQLMSKLLEAAVAKGSDFKTTAAGMKLKAETIPAFVPYGILTAKTPQTDPRLQTIAYEVTSLQPGQVSDPVPLSSDNTTLILHLDRRDKADPAGLADFETRYRSSQDQQLRQAVAEDWTDWKSKQPGTHKPPDLESFGSVE